MPARYQDLTLFDFYREFDWGFHVHIGGWFDTVYSGEVRTESRIDGQKRYYRFITPGGELTRMDMLVSDGTWSRKEFFIKEVRDLEIMRYVVEHTHFEPRFERIASIREQLGEWGQGDIVLSRSPFGKLVHEYMGFEQVIYALADAPGPLIEFMEVQEQKNLELVELAGRAPERLVIMSDHTDEILIAAPSRVQPRTIPYQMQTSKSVDKGMTEAQVNDRTPPGIQFGRLSREQCEKLHDASLEILNRTGVQLHDEEAVNLLRWAGANVSDGNRVRIPGRLVERALATAPKEVVLYDQQGQLAIRAGDHRCYYGTGSDCLNILDHRTGERRRAVLNDVAEGAVVCDALEHVDFVMSMFLPSDVDPMLSDRYQMEAMLRNTTKPIVYVTNEFSGAVDAFERANFESWEANGSKTLAERAAERVSTILAGHRPEPLPPDVQQAVRSVVQQTEKRVEKQQNQER